MRLRSIVVCHIAVALCLGPAPQGLLARAQENTVPSYARAASQFPDPRTQSDATVETQLRGKVHSHPNNYDPNHTLGEFYVQRHKLQLGATYLKKAEEIDGHHYENGYDLALAYLELGQADSALSQLQKMLKTYDTADVHNLLAEAKDRLGDHASALQQYHRAAEIEPSEQNVFDLANFLLQHQNYSGFLSQAVKYFRYGAEKYPDSAQLRVGLGVAEYADGHYDQAVDALCAAVDLNPNDEKPYDFLGRVSKVSPDKVPEVRQRLADFVRRYPRSSAANYYYALSLAQLSKGDPELDTVLVETLLTTAISLNPDLYEAHFQLGLIYEKQQKGPESIHEFSETVKLRPDFLRAHYHLAQLYNHSGQKELAAREVEVLHRLRQQGQGNSQNEVGP